MERFLLALAATLLLASFAVYKYRVYLKAGPGGFGQHPVGFARCMCVKLLLWATGSDLLEVATLQQDIDAGGLNARGWLTEKDVPTRMGDREPLVP